MRYLCPDDCAGVSHDGARLTRAGDGTIEAPAEAAAALAPHGLLPVTADQAKTRGPGPRAADNRRMLR